MIDPEAITEAKRALGRQLAACRDAAGLNQHQLAPLIHFGRSTIANAETGHSICSRTFWERCDQALHADGALLCGYDDLQALIGTQRAQVAELAGPSASPSSAKCKIDKGSRRRPCPIRWSGSQPAGRSSAHRWRIKNTLAMGGSTQ
jgi:hypothetical protein